MPQIDETVERERLQLEAAEKAELRKHFAHERRIAHLKAKWGHEIIGLNAEATS